jgi:hypothetical protein
MRKATLLGAILIAALTGFIGFAPASAATPPRHSGPTCLISDAGRYTKTLTCTQLVLGHAGAVGTGRVTVGRTPAVHALTVAVQVRRTGRGRTGWMSLTTATTVGRGDLTASTRAVWARRGAELRACTTLDHGPAVCTAP